MAKNMIKTKQSSDFLNSFIRAIGWPTSCFFDVRLVGELDGGSNHWESSINGLRDYCQFVKIIFVE